MVWINWFWCFLSVPITPLYQQTSHKSYNFIFLTIRRKQYKIRCYTLYSLFHICHHISMNRWICYVLIKKIFLFSSVPTVMCNFFLFWANKNHLLPALCNLIDSRWHPQERKLSPPSPLLPMVDLFLIDFCQIWFDSSCNTLICSWHALFVLGYYLCT